MKVIATEQIKVETCGSYIVFAEKGERLKVISVGYGKVYLVENNQGVQLTVSERSVEPV